MVCRQQIIFLRLFEGFLHAQTGAVHESKGVIPLSRTHLRSFLPVFQRLGVVLLDAFSVKIQRADGTQGFRISHFRALLIVFQRLLGGLLHAQRLQSGL